MSLFWGWRHPLSKQAYEIRTTEEKTLFPGTACGTRGRDWPSLLHLWSCPALSLGKDPESLPGLCFTLYFMPLLIVLINHEKPLFISRKDSPPQYISMEERHDRCGTSHQVFPILVKIWYPLTLCSFKIGNILRLLVFWYSPLMMHHCNGFLYYFSLFSQLFIFFKHPHGGLTFSLWNYSLWQ